ncbi:MAG: acyl carrier protein [Tissierellia bacterium]|nr:acyl carrier protein [Tissierellia bacterium]
MKDKILQLIAEQFNMDIDDLNEEMSFEEDLNADSIELVELVMSIEDEFDLELDDEKLESIKTIGDVINFIEEEE